MPLHGFLVLLPAALASASSSVEKSAPEQVLCSIGDTAERPCAFTDRVDSRGLHHMTFTSGDYNVTFVGRPQSGWWSGRLNGKPAMGYERNRGNMVFSTYDLSTRFSWWYPRSEHGTY